MGKTVLTTGVNSGIGLVTAIELARRGFRSIGSVRSEEKAEVVAKAAADAGVEVETVLLDVADTDACHRVMAGLRLYGLVNNAGYSGMGAIEDVSDDDARQQIEAMVIGPIRLAKLALPAMREQGGGRIVNVSSMMGRITTPLAGWYQATKHALEAVSDALRMEVAGDNVKVILVEPGGFRTNIWSGARGEANEHTGSRYEASYKRSMQTEHLIERFMGDPAQCAKVIAGAVSSRFPRSRYLVGYDAQMSVLADSLTPTAIKDRVLRLAYRL